jgi:hypothetical protein
VSVPGAIHCPRCGQLVAVQNGGRVEIRHRGRGYDIEGTVKAVTCERCRTTFDPQDGNGGRYGRDERR